MRNRPHGIREKFFIFLTLLKKGKFFPDANGAPPAPNG